MAQRQIQNKIHFGQTLNPLDDYAGVSSVNDDGNLQSLIDKVGKLSSFWQSGKADGDLIRYIPNLVPVTRQDVIKGIEPREAYAAETYVDKRTIDFTIKLAPNTYTNYATMEIVFPIWFVKQTDKDAQLAATLMPVNNFFARWITDIDIKRYPDDLRILPNDKTLSVYDFANAQLKYLPNDSVKKIQKPFLYSNLPVSLDAGVERRQHANANAGKRSDQNLAWRIANLHNHAFAKNEYRIPLGLLCDLGLCSFHIQTDTRITLTLERKLTKLFEDTAKIDNIPNADPDASIEFWDRPYISYQEVTLTNIFESYLKDILKDENGVRMGVLPNPFQQTFEVAAGAQTISVDMQGASRDINFIEISLEYDTSHEHETVYDSYGLELAAKLIESVRFVNASKAYSLTGKLSYDSNNRDEKYELYKMFVAYHCDGPTFAPLSKYKDNPIYQDMTDEFEYTANNKDDRIYIDMRRSKGNYKELEKITRDDSSLVVYVKLKAAAAKKLRLRIVGYSQGEYWYAYTNKGYVMTYLNYNIAKADKL